MARIAGVNVPTNKRLIIALTYIYGIGPKFSKDICEKINIDGSKRVNNLNEDVKILLEHGDIEMGHARCLLALEGEAQSDAARLAVAKALTVRETEKLVRSILEPAPKKEVQEKDPDVKQLEQKLAENLGAKVEINYNKKGKGKLVISYTTLDELDGILSRIN